MTDPETHGETNGRIRIDPTLAFNVLAWLFSALVAGIVTYGAVNARVSVVESKQGESERRLERIENKVDQLLRGQLR